jgi:hypothetical protein
MQSEPVKEFWIDTRLESAEMEGKLIHALNTCYLIHVWGMKWLKEHWVKNMVVLHHNELMPKLRLFLRENGYGEGVMGHSMETTLHRTINEFLLQLQPTMPIEDTVTIHLPSSVPKGAFTEIDIRSRKIWRKYLEEEGKLSSGYGTFYLEGEWVSTIRAQALDMRVGIDLLPHLWKSLTIREPVQTGQPWQVRFNFSDATSPRAVYKSKRKKETPWLNDQVPG